MTSATAEKLFDKCMEQLDAAWDMDDPETAQRLWDRGERLWNFIVNNREIEKNCGSQR